MRMDIVDELIELSVELCSISKVDALRMESELCRLHGGTSDHYIHKTMLNAQELHQQAVREAQRTGRVKETAKSHGINRRTLYCLLTQARMLGSQEFKRNVV